jgi:hypothetical protein
MSDSKRGDEGQQQKAGLGFGHLSMNEVPPSARVSVEDAPKPASRAGLFVILVLLAVAAVVFGARMIANVAPGQEAEARLRQGVQALPAWQKGDIMRAEYMTGSTLRLEFSTRLNTTSDTDREAIRQMTKDVFEVLRKERPDRDLYIRGFQAGEQIVRGEYRYRSNLVGPGGQQVPDITVRVKGDPEGGIQGAFSSSARQRR